MKRPKIFISNDDGIRSPGLRAAVQAVVNLGEILVVAPETQQTGMGRSFHGNPDAALVPVSYEIDGHQIEAFQCACSPALAVRHGINVLCASQQPDLLISGINYGENVGSIITSSGTIGAAYEGASQGIPALAVSMQTDPGAYFHYTEQDWNVAAHFLEKFARVLLTKTMPFDVDVLKVDVPQHATSQTPWKLTRLSRQPYYLATVDNPSLDSKVRDAKVNIAVDSSSLRQRTDIHAITVEQVVSVTPLSLDLTSRVDFDEFHKSFQEE